MRYLPVARRRCKVADPAAVLPFPTPTTAIEQALLQGAAHGSDNDVRTITRVGVVIQQVTGV